MQYNQLSRMSQKAFIYTAVIFFMCFVLIYRNVPCEPQSNYLLIPKADHLINDCNNRKIPYNREMPLIFIGGMPRSGATLMCAMLDAHPAVRCGEETQVIQSLIDFRTDLKDSKIEIKNLLEAGIDDKVLDSAISAFILEIIALQGKAALHLCNKDPVTLKFSLYFKKLFPNAKFIFMIRDGRGTVHSIISRKMTISGLKINDYRQGLSKWSTAMEMMYSQCLQVGADRCMPVYYEQLVLQPELWMRRIIKFLDIPWNSSVLHHEDFIDKSGGISVSKTEMSSNRIIRYVNREVLNEWVGKIPRQIVIDMAKIAPMLRTLGYDPYANPPNYGRLDPKVADNALHIQKNVAFRIY